jgi:hypothetical protein
LSVEAVLLPVAPMRAVEELSVNNALIPEVLDNMGHL